MKKTFPEILRFIATHVTNKEQKEQKPSETGNKLTIYSKKFLTKEIIKNKKITKKYV